MSFRIAVSLVVLCLLPMLAPLEAAASDRARARALLAEGAKFLQAGDFVQALDRYEQAYALVPSPNILYNFGLTYDGLGRRAEAFDALQRFLYEATKATPQYQVDARRQVERLRGQIAFVAVSCDVAGAEVFVSGRRIGTTPMSGPAAVDPGTHDVVARKEGLPPQVQRLAVVAGQNADVRMEILPKARPRELGIASSTDVASRQPAPAALQSSGERASSTSPGRVVAWVGLAGAAAALALGVQQTVSYAGRKQEFDNLSVDSKAKPGQRVFLCGERDSMRGRDDRCQGLWDKAQDARKVALVGYAAAAVLTGVSAALFAASGGADARTDTAWGCGVGGFAASCKFTF